MSLHKTAELPPDRNYVLGFHPHGIISYSAFVTFATEALDVSKKFPGDRTLLRWSCYWIRTCHHGLLFLHIIRGYAVQASLSIYSPWYR